MGDERMHIFVMGLGAVTSTSGITDDFRSIRHEVYRSPRDPHHQRGETPTAWSMT
jgi:hypothetical protein